jgi:hypothetical protein
MKYLILSALAALVIAFVYLVVASAEWLKRLWLKYRLYHQPLFIGRDTGSDDCTVTVYAKELDGVIYIIDEKVERP